MKNLVEKVKTFYSENREQIEDVTLLVVEGAMAVGAVYLFAWSKGYGAGVDDGVKLANNISELVNVLNKG